MKNLWKDVADDGIKAELTRCAFWYATQIYIELFGKIVINSADPSWAANDVDKKSAMTIAEIRGKRDEEEKADINAAPPADIIKLRVPL